MPKFRKKPIVIEAEQYLEHSSINPKGVCLGKPGDCQIATVTRRESGFVDLEVVPHVHTIHNDQVVAIEHGDWILPEPDGKHFYPCKPDIFEATYEPVE